MPGCGLGGAESSSSFRAVQMSKAALIFRGCSSLDQDSISKMLGKGEEEEESPQPVFAETHTYLPCFQLLLG